MSDDNLAGYDEIAAADGGVEAGAAQVAPVSVPEMKSLLGLAVGAVVVAALYFGKDVLIPVTLAVMLSFLLSPIVNFLQRLRLGRAPAVIVTVLGALGMFGLVLTLIGSEAASLTAEAPRYAKTIESKIQGVQAVAAARLASVTKQLGRSNGGPPSQSGVSPAVAPGSTTVSTAEGRRAVLVEVASPPLSPFVVVKTILQPVLGPLETFFIVLIVAIFILLQKEDIRDRFIRLFGSSDLYRTTLALNDAGQRLSRYFLSQLAVNTCFGVVIGAGLWVIGIPSPGLWGVLAGLLRFVPYIGAFLAALAPMALGAAVDPGWAMVTYVGLLFVIVEPLTGYAVEPLLYGHSTGLSPVSVIVSAVFWTWIWGPIGLIMSTPLTLCFVVLGRHVKSLEFFDVMLGDRPALAAKDTFYQRILAANPDEALLQAELFLADGQLVDYYDGVAVEGLRLAAEDERRGTIDRRQANQMLGAMRSVMKDLQDRSVVSTDIETANDSALPDYGRVACIAGGGTFDTAVCAMLAQVLKQNGIVATIIPQDAASRDRISDLDLSDISVVVVCYLELTGSPAQLRYLIQRLHHNYAQVRVIVGLCGNDDAISNDSSFQQTIGADQYARSIGEVLSEITEDKGSDATRASNAV